LVILVGFPKGGSNADGIKLGLITQGKEEEWDEFHVAPELMD
jgi:hypothetical protein